MIDDHDRLSLILSPQAEVITTIQSLLLLLLEEGYTKL
jgi:hypothetical protein